MYVMKNGWKIVTFGRLYNLYLEVMNYAKQKAMWKNEYPLLCTRKSCAAMGTCFTRRNEDGSYSHTIVISELMLDKTDDQIRAILIHEIAHAMTPFLHHGLEWKNAANQLGERWGYWAERCVSDEDIQKNASYKYEVYCPVCGTVWRYMRKCKTVLEPESYRCAKDKSKLKLRDLGEK